MQATLFPNLILFLLLLLCSILLLHAAGDAGDATVDHYDGGARQCPLKQQQQLLPSIADDDDSNGATITGTAIIEMQPGQKVSDS